MAEFSYDKIKAKEVIPEKPCDTKLNKTTNKLEESSLMQMVMMKKGNKATMQMIKDTNDILQRQVQGNEKNIQLEKIGRFDFSHELQQALGLKPGEHRCHTVSYETITQGVLAPINACILAKQDVALGALEGLLEAIYPSGGVAKNHANHPNQNQLDKIAADQYGVAQLSIDEIEKAVTDINKKQSVSKQDLEHLVKCANFLIYALNNSPDNLREGFGNTNSSIQGGLDLEQDNGKASQIIIGGNNVNVIRITDEHEAVVWTMLKTSFGGPGGSLYLFTSGKKLQSSNNSNQISSNMNSANPQKVAIENPTNRGKGDFIFFNIV